MALEGVLELQTELIKSHVISFEERGRGGGGSEK